LALQSRGASRENEKTLSNRAGALPLTRSAGELLQATQGHPGSILKNRRRALYLDMMPEIQLRAIKALQACGVAIDSVLVITMDPKVLLGIAEPTPLICDPPHRKCPPA
jgi:hypothetical protein